MGDGKDVVVDPGRPAAATPGGRGRAEAVERAIADKFAIELGGEGGDGEQEPVGDGGAVGAAGWGQAK